MNSDRRKAASKILSSFPRLAALATKVRLDAFTRIKKAIDGMVNDLLKEKDEELKTKDFCVDEFNTNEMETEKQERTKEDLLAKIEDEEGTIKALTESIDQLKAEIDEDQKQIKRAGDDRENENKEFQMTVADQRATQKLLKAALNVLKGFYDKEEKAALIQTSKEPAGPAPPAGFKEFKKQKAGTSSGGVMGMIQQIINDAKSMEAEAVRAESDA